MEFRDKITTVAIPFEIHLTTGPMTIDREQDFIDCCQINKARPLFIELSRGIQTHQPMLSKVVVSARIKDVFAEANILSDSLLKNNFGVKRLKVEVPAVHCGFFEGLETSYIKYFEWHGKINYINKDDLAAICSKHGVHLSLNSLKGQNGQRFITLREFKDIGTFAARVKALSVALDQGGWHIAKQESEYCIYDNNSFLDNGWL